MAYRWEQVNKKHFLVADSGRVMVELWEQSDGLISVMDATEEDLKDQRYFSLPAAMVAVEAYYNKDDT